MSKYTALVSGKTGTGRFAEVRELVDLFQKARNYYQHASRWTVSIKSTDMLYDLAHRWFLEGATLEKAPRALSARYTPDTGKTDDSIELASSRENSKISGKVQMYYDDQHERKLVVEGHRITISLSKPDNTSAIPDNYKARVEPDTLWFYARSREGQQAVIRMLESLAANQEKIKPALYLTNTWGGWSKRDDLPARPLDSVILAEGQLERLRDDILAFLSQEQEYVRRGIPWHRGYLLHGPPGCGKTSVARALAASLNLNLWYAPLSDMDKDAGLLKMVNEISPRSILLLEDVDIFHAMRERDDDQGPMAVTMAGLLNALDGVATPHGLITIMTTNNLDVIDPAILRPGRIDLSELIDLPNFDQLARLWKHFYAQPVFPYFSVDGSFKGSTSEAMEVFKQHPNDPKEGWLCLMEL